MKQDPPCMKEIKLHEYVRFWNGKEECFGGKEYVNIIHHDKRTREKKRNYHKDDNFMKACAKFSIH